VIACRVAGDRDCEIRLGVRAQDGVDDVARGGVVGDVDRDQRRVAVGGDERAVCCVDIGDRVAHPAGLACRPHELADERAELLVVDSRARRAHDHQIGDGALRIGREGRV
jgi:hypothetical protein